MNYKTNSKVEIKRKKRPVDFKISRDNLIEDLNTFKGAYLCSSFEYPGRYTRWDLGFVKPPLEIRGNGRKFIINGLNERGKVLVDIIYSHIRLRESYKFLNKEEFFIEGEVKEPEGYVTEDKRSRQNSIFTLIRDIRRMFYSEEDGFLGLYGSFGYDLIYQFEDMELKKERLESNEDLVLFIPDSVMIMDHRRTESFVYDYEFRYLDYSTEGVERTGIDEVVDDKKYEELINPVKGNYAGLVRKAKKYFERGDLFEVVPSQVLEYNTEKKASDIFERLIEINPSPYGFLINHGNEKLIGASPEMYVRVTGNKVETCPISGTVKRGKNAVEDYENIMKLLNSPKEESELTMCTDVDRNDKSRICVPGSINVIGRRQIEKYSHLIHTVDHVEGILRDEYDSLDAFMTHMWAVTVTGAPKRRAVQWIEENEQYCREWYAGAVGCLGFNGDINTGLTLRTIYMKGNKARVRVGATLLNDSIPEDEEEETLIKAAAMIKVLQEKPGEDEAKEAELIEKLDFNILIIDHEDSFVHTLGDYFRRLGADTETVRHNHAMECLREGDYDLVVLSPGPGRPEDFNVSEKIGYCVENGLPIFGVCLGLQSIVEYFGGSLGQLDIPVHGKKSNLDFEDKSIIFKGIEGEICVGRYHSLYGNKIPENLRVTSRTSDGIVMSVEDEERNIYAVQFHPESVMSMDEGKGLKLMKNIIDKLMEE
ncbi:anthranilate synthase, component I [Dethiosulfatibacter aminovorans DSM 17477]|uniref:Anthranilate synthase n=1 Tax=Dethiosulfatibacter aminovorans DSM 17477 TaxID=1121476 RepID=A0A1M6J9A7_9FIRM|nr:anthranilate synthase component I [Dethiosulfatibacter aminovorans]SHJ43279.1 anthranilate synthase, component I [Dethiosulfatibacter aminovorans DSM 17477]